MYSKPLLRRYIAEALHSKDWNEKELAEKLGMPPTNFNRAVNQEGFNLTLPQFSEVVQLLNLSSNQVHHILTGKKAREAKADLISAYAKKIADQLRDH